MSLRGRLVVAMAMLLAGLAGQAGAGTITIAGPVDARTEIGAGIWRLGLTDWFEAALDPASGALTLTADVNRDDAVWDTQSDTKGAFGSVEQPDFAGYAFTRPSGAYCFLPPPWWSPPPPWGNPPPPWWSPPPPWWWLPPPWWEPPPDPGPHSTPDGGATLMLLGGGLVGLGALRRRFHG
jgi:hypothetical protein